MTDQINISPSSKPTSTGSQQTLTQDQKEELAKKVFDNLLREITYERERLGR
ncbi:hypothetical protein KQH54_02145 [bacterium]|nr:hypothetical protein [bacterium]